MPPHFPPSPNGARPLVETVHEPWHDLALAFVPGLQPPADQLLTLLTRRKAKQTWDCQRTDLQDRSLMGHQLALACLAIHAGWSDTDLGHLLAAHRALYTVDEADTAYLQRLIWTAHHVLDRESAQETLQQPLSADTMSRQTIRDTLAKVFGCMVIRLTQEGEDNAIFSVQLNGHLIPIGPARAFRDQAQWQDLLVAHGFRPFNRMKEPVWNNVVAAMLHLVERHVNTDTAWAEWLRGLLRQYMQQEERPFAYHTLYHTLPFLDDGAVIGLHLEHCRQWARLRFPDANLLSRTTWMALLRGLGFVTKRVSAREETASVCRNYWTTPATFLTEDLVPAEMTAPTPPPLDAIPF